MLKLSKKVEYALISVMHMDAVHNGELATAREMADQYSIPGELLGKVLQLLAKARLIESVQGSKGGYRLVQPVEKITLGQIVEAVEGPVHLASCQSDPACCEQYSNCNIKQPVLEVQRRMMDYMYGLPLSTFRKSLKAGPLPVGAP
jgi:Rrf2 family transcriptional regulator, cysteine metabolism repressor